MRLMFCNHVIIFFFSSRTCKFSSLFSKTKMVKKGKLESTETGDEDTLLEI